MAEHRHGRRADAARRSSGRATCSATRSSTRQAQFARQAEQDNAEFDLENAATTPGGDCRRAGLAAAALARARQAAASSVADRRSAGRPHAAAHRRRRSSAQAAHQAARAKAADPADTYIDRSLYDRCITRGIAGSILPVIYNNGNEIVQAPGYVAILNEMIHETRDRAARRARRTSIPTSRCGWATRAAGGKATRSSSRPRTSPTAPGSPSTAAARGISDAIKVTERFTRDRGRHDRLPDDARRSEDVDARRGRCAIRSSATTTTACTSTRATRATTRCSTS